MSTTHSNNTLGSPPTAQHHEHRGHHCPVVGEGHDYCHPHKGDARSPCPALNALANHGYLPRDGKDLSAFDLIRALREGYSLSYPLAFILAFGAVLILGQYRRISLADLARHNLIEHDASLFHRDAREGDEYAPRCPDNSLLKHVILQGGHYIPGRITLLDVANIRVKREIATPLNSVHAEIARGEMAIAIGVLGGRKAATEGLELSALRQWAKYERLPDGWKPDHTQGLYRTYKMAKVIRDRMGELKSGKVENILDNESYRDAPNTPAPQAEPSDSVNPN